MKKSKILIVDDQPDNLAVLSEYIEESFAYAEIIVSLSASRAIDLAHAEMPDLVLTDWEMPGMNGIELVRTLRAGELTRDIPVIMSTGVRIRPQDLQEALDAGANDFIRKPVDPIELTARIRAMLTLRERTREIIMQREQNAVTLLELERERAARALLQKEQAELSEQLKKRFFSKMTHEFRTPLTLILGPLAEIEAETREPRIQRQAGLALRNSKILLRLINQLLDIARTDAGHLRPRPQRLDLIAFVRERVQAFTPLGRKKELAVSFTADEALLVDFDPDMLEKVLNNLLSNAVKFTPANGRVDVSVDAPPDRDGMARVTVRDTGIGIPEAAQPFVFDRFFRVDDGKTVAREGTGLGLPLAKELIDLHGGEISVSSLEGLGSKFVFLLPLRQEKVHTANDAAPDPLATALEQAAIADESPIEDDIDAENTDAPLLLIVEDNADIRTYIHSALEAEYAILEAADGLAGIEKARQLVPDVIVSDVMMPGADGFELLRQLKADETTSHIPIVLLTAKTGVDARIEGRAVGADAYLPKPFHLPELKACLRGLLDNRARLQEAFRKQMLTTPVAPDSASREEQFLHKAVSIISAELGNADFSAEDMASAMALSRAQLHRKLKALTDQSTTEFMRNYRLEYAYQLLRQDAGTISEIAYRVGFGSQSYFTRAFSARYGKTPTAVRKE